jgi:hypothetical protein
MTDWPFPWECGKLQWRTQLEENGVIQVKKALEDFISRVRRLQNESVHPGQAESQYALLEGAEKDLRLVTRWMDFCK